MLWSYVERNGRPVAFYTDKASLFQTTPKLRRIDKDQELQERQPLPPTQIRRALRELGITWIAAHSPQAKAYASNCTSCEPWTMFSIRRLSFS